MAVRLTYFLDPLFQEPLPCCDAQGFPFPPPDPGDDPDDPPPPPPDDTTDSFSDESVQDLGTDDQGRRWITDRGVWIVSAGSARAIGQGTMLTHVDGLVFSSVNLRVTVLAGRGGIAASIKSGVDYLGVLVDVDRLRIFHGTTQIAERAMQAHQAIELVVSVSQTGADTYVQAWSPGIVGDVLRATIANRNASGFVGLYADGAAQFDDWKGKAF